MDVKKALKDPEAFLNSLSRPIDSKHLVSLRQMNSEFTEYSRLIKELKKQKSLISRQFKGAKGCNETLNDLKSQNQAISIEINQAEINLKNTTRKANRLIDSLLSDETPKLPGQFNVGATNLETEINFEVTEATSNPAWSHFVRNHPESSSCHNPALIRVIEKAFGHKTRLIIAKADGEIVGGLLVTFVNSKLFGRNAVSTPFFNYGGPLTNYPNVAEALILHAQHFIEDGTCDQVEIRTTRGSLSPQCQQKKVSMIRSLPADDETLDNELGSKLRAQVNRAREHSPETRFGGIELLNDFYRVFAQNMRDLGTPVYGKNWFRALIDEKDLKTTIVVCYVNSKPVSAGFLIGSGQMLEIPWASTIKSANSMNMNMWMYRQILSYAIREKYQFFDFGRSTKDAGTYRFKKQWGTTEVQHYWYYLTDSEKHLSETNPDNPKFKAVIYVWQRLPVWLTKLIGPPVVKQIP